MPVYFIQSGDDGPIKIGVSTNVRVRFGKLRTDCPGAKLIGVLAGDAETESQLHRRFASSRLHGEWFSPHPDLLALVAECSVLVPFRRRSKHNGHPLAQWIANEGITKSRFAQRAGISQALVSMLCSGKVWPRREIMQAIRIATHGEISADDFLDPLPVGARRAAPEAA